MAALLPAEVVLGAEGHPGRFPMSLPHFISSCLVPPPQVGLWTLRGWRGPWDVAVDPPPLFADCEMHLPVPHTHRSG